MNSLSRITIIFLLFGAIATTAAAGCSATKTSGASTGVDEGGRGAPAAAPDFTVKTLSGEIISLSDFRGKPVVLNFAASWCGPCETEAPTLARMYDKYKDQVAFVGLAVRDSEQSQREFADRHGLTFPIGMDPQGNIMYNYQKAGKVSLAGIPTTFFLDREGNIATFWVGPVSDSTLERLIQTLI